MNETPRKPLRVYRSEPRDEKVPFLRWLVIASVTLAGLFVLWRTDVMSRIWQCDSSMLSAIILAFFLVVSACLGRATWRAPHDPGVQWQKIGWFSSELCLGLGMLGTVIGLVLMLSGFDGLDPANNASVRQLLGNLGGSMGTALYTTMTGLACGMVIKIQTFNLALASKDADE